MAPTQDDSLSLLHTERISQYVSLPPSCLATPLPALCASIFSPLLLSYYPPARGIVLAYEDVELSATPPSQTQHNSRSRQEARNGNGEREDQELLLRHIDEYTAPFLWATVSFLIWRPAQNAWLTGRITHQATTHITLAHLNTFPISVLAQHLPSDWRWHSEQAGRLKKGFDGRVADEGGWWVDGRGEKVEEGVVVRVRIRDFDGRVRGKGVAKIEGSLLTVEEERERGEKGKGKERKRGLQGMEVD